MSERQIKCRCKIQGDGFAEVCRSHYTAYMKKDMKKSLITTESYAKKIWRKLKLKVLPQ